MTLIVGWVSADNKPRGKQISTLYLASDSRYTWKQQGCKRVVSRTDYGKKLYASSKFPEVFGFCGGVDLSKHILDGLITSIDSGTFISGNDTLDAKVEKVSVYITNILQEYPKEQISDSTILYGTKVGSHFRLQCFKISKDSLTSGMVPLPNESKVVFYDGSGRKCFQEKWIYANNEKSNEYNLCRGVYHCISDTIETIVENDVGGVPQLIGIYRGLNAPSVFGIIKNGHRYLDGKEYMGDINLSDNIEWRNDNFERVNPRTLKLKEGAQAQPFA